MVLSSCKHHVAGVGIFSAGFSFALVQIFPIMPDSFLWKRGFWYCAALIVQWNCSTTLRDIKVLAVVFSNDDTKD